MGSPARFFLPKDQSTLCLRPRLVAMDMEARARAMAVGPRDLHAEHRRGRAGGAARLLRLVDAIRADSGDLPSRWSDSRRAACCRAT